MVPTYPLFTLGPTPPWGRVGGRGFGGILRQFDLPRTRSLTLSNKPGGAQDTRMWGSLARGITATVRETAHSAASAAESVGAREVLRRVGEVVAPPLHRDDEDEDEYEDDEDDQDDDDDDDGAHYDDEDEEDEGWEEGGVEFEDVDGEGRDGRGAARSSGDDIVDVEDGRMSSDEGDASAVASDDCGGEIQMEEDGEGDVLIAAEAKGAE